MNRNFVRTFALVSLLTTASACRSQDGSTPTHSSIQSAELLPGPKALLVGCTIYPELGEVATLQGPANDVLLMRELFEGEPYRFPKGNIVVLSEASGDEALLPTKANIDREFQRLARDANESEHIVFFFAGHGTQIPDQTPPLETDPEPDGMDEVLLPRDAERWDASAKRLRNAIVDDELKVWLDKIIEKKAIPWVIIDACHSGTVVRAAVEEKNRNLTNEELGIPDEEIERARRSHSPSNASRGFVRENTPLEVPEYIPSLAALYAALPSEPTPELAPPDGGSEKVYGLLTYTLYKTLTTAKSPISYSDLAHRIRAQYRNWGRLYPTPVAEGEYLSSQVLGSDQIPEKKRFVLSHAEGVLRLDVGTLYGIHEGSIFTVKPPPGEQNPDEILAYVKVVDDGLDFFQSEVIPHEYNGLPATPTLPEGAICEPVFVNFGDLVLRVAAVRQSFDDKPLSAPQETADQRLLEELSASLRGLAKEGGSIVQYAESPEKADWILQVHRERIELVPARGWLSESESLASPPRFGPVPTERGEMENWLQERLRRIAQVHNLLELAGNFSGGPEVNVGVRMARYKDQGDNNGKQVEEDNAIVLRKDEIVGFEARNEGFEPIDVTLLFIDAGYGITTLFPRRSVLDNRLSKGNSVSSGRSRVNVETTGQEYVLAIAVQAQNEPVDFAFLAQPTIEQVRSTVRGANGIDSPLGQLLKYSHFREGSTRGLTLDEFDNFAFDLISWTVAKDPAVATNDKH